MKNDEAIDFRSLAGTGGVCVNFLFNHPELRARIDRLRVQRQEQTRPPAAAAPGSDNAVIRALTAKLTHERQRRHEEITQLRSELAAAHGEVLRLRLAASGSRVPDTRPGAP